MKKDLCQKARSDLQGTFIDIERRGVQRCNFLSPSLHPEPDHAAWNGAQIVREILGPHAWATLHQHAVRSHHVASGGETNRRHRGVIDDAGKLRVKSDAHPTAQRLAGAAAKFLNDIACVSRDHAIQRADRSFHCHDIRNDIRGVAALDLTDRNNQGIASIGLSRNGLIDQRDKLRRDGDRIDCVMGARTVTSATADFYYKILAKRRLRTRSQRKLSRIERGIDMQGDDRIDSGERAALDHFARAVTNFFRRLEDATPPDRNRARRPQRAQGAQQYGGMRVVTARVHHPGVSRAIRNLVLLGDGQRVDVGAKGDYRSLGNRWSRNGGDDSPPVRSRLVQDPGGRKPFANKGRRRVFRPAKLRIGVKMAANLYKLRREPCEAMVYLFGNRWRLRRCAAGHGAKSHVEDIYTMVSGNLFALAVARPWMTLTSAPTDAGF